MRIATLWFSVALIQAIVSYPANAATCSCAGVPLLGPIDVSTTEPGDFYFNFTAEVHEISDLVGGVKEIKDETGRERSTLSQVVSVTYGLADKWSVTGLLSYVEHRRKIGSSFFPAQNSSGLGDGIILFRYTPIYLTPFSRHEISLGFGARLPIGKNDAGGLIVLSEDMQPGVGSWGKILWAGYSYAFNQAATVQLNAFGDEFNLAVGLSQSIGSSFGYSASLRYRITVADQRNGFEIPNTGGEWLDFVPAIQYSLNGNLDVGAYSGRIPIARDLDWCPAIYYQLFLCLDTYLCSVNRFLNW